MDSSLDRLALPLTLRLNLPLVDRLGLRMAQEEITHRPAEKLTRARAVALLVATLPPEVPGAAPSSDAALESYISMLKSHATAVKRAADRGANSGGATGGAGVSSGGDARSLAKRPRAIESDDDDESDGETEQRGRSSKKRLIFEHELPWFADDILAGGTLSSELQKTQATLQLFARDVAATKQFVATSVSAPEFPDSEWDSVINDPSTSMLSSLQLMRSPGRTSTQRGWAPTKSSLEAQDPPQKRIRLTETESWHGISRREPSPSPSQTDEAQRVIRFDTN
ncbi:hypothetical protein B0H13DRAFT_2300423 [Mycena leptocephala]|nr:hypothetical protein B0H13DRAFT_2300423 [Mycena leptocephala]